MTKPSIPVGIICSQSGPYQAMGREILKSALMAVDEINDQRRFRFLDSPPMSAIPAASFPSITRSATTSSAIPASSISSAATRRHRASRYCRSSNAPIACSGIPRATKASNAPTTSSMSARHPNHNVLPLVRYVLDNMSRHLFCVGSNYVWTWETNRVTRELVTRGARKHSRRTAARARRKRRRAYRRRDRAPQAAGRLQHAGRQFELRFHSRLSCRHHGRRSRHSDAELQPLRTGTQDRRTGICRLHHLVSLFREHPPAREPRIRRSAGRRVTVTPAAPPSTGSPPMSRSICWRARCSGPAHPILPRCGAPRPAIATIRRRDRSGSTATTTIASLRHGWRSPTRKDSLTSSGKPTRPSSRILTCRNSTSPSAFRGKRRTDRRRMRLICGS